jgi:Putative Zn-dependent protease, contains TPR repeats
MGTRSKRFARLFGLGLIALQVFLLTSFAQTKVAKTVGEKSAHPDVLSQQRFEELKKQGSANLQKQEWESASSAFTAALTIKPENSECLYGKALALFNLKQVSEANADLDTAVGELLLSKENNALLADSLVLSAVISAVQNENSLAVQKLEKAVNIAPAHFDANFSLGRAYFGNGDVERSITAFRRAVSILPNHIKARFFLATALEREGNYTDALKEYRKILELEPNSVEGNVGLGVLLLKTDGDSSADGLSALQKAVTLDANLYEGQVTLGRVLIRLNRASEAVEYLQKAADIAPNNPEPHFQLALAYRKLGNRDKSAAETEIVKRIHERRRGVSNQTPQ